MRILYRTLTILPLVLFACFFVCHQTIQAQSPSQDDWSISLQGPSKIVFGTNTKYISYTLTATLVQHMNTSGDPYEIEVRTNGIPHGLTFVSETSDERCEEVSGQIICRAQYSERVEDVLSFNVVFALPSTCTYENRPSPNQIYMRVFGSTFDPNTANNESQELRTTLECPEIDLGIDILSSVPAHKMGDEYSYDLTLTNNSSVDEKNAFVAFHLGTSRSGGNPSEYVGNSAGLECELTTSYVKLNEQDLKGWWLICSNISLAAKKSISATITFRSVNFRSDDDPVCKYANYSHVPFIESRTLYDAERANNKDAFAEVFSLCGKKGFEYGPHYYRSSSSISVAASSVSSKKSSIASSRSKRLIFSDVRDDHPNADAIEYMKEKEIVQGYEDGTFHPDATINRAEFVKILIGAAPPKQDVKCDATSNAFVDVLPNAWYAVYVCVAKSYGYVGGYPDGTFKPEKSVNLAEALKIIAETLELDVVESVSGEWYQRYVDAFERIGVSTSDFGSLDSAISRGQMAQLIWLLQGSSLTTESDLIVTVGNSGTAKTYTHFSNRFTVKSETHTSTNVKLIIDIPEGFTVTESMPCVKNESTLTCNLGTIIEGSKKFIDVDFEDRKTCKTSGTANFNVRAEGDQKEMTLSNTKIRQNSQLFCAQ